MYVYQPKPIFKQFFIYSKFFFGHFQIEGLGRGKTYRAATEERTGEVKEIRIKNDPENTIRFFFVCLTSSLTIFEAETKKKV